MELKNLTKKELIQHINILYGDNYRQHKEIENLKLEIEVVKNILRAYLRDIANV